jgi:thimet oligopeptidase
MTRFTALFALTLVLAACPKSEPEMPGPSTTPGPGAGGAPAEPAEPAEPSKPAPAQPNPVAVFGQQCRVGLEQARADLAAILAVEGERTMENTLVKLDEMVMHYETSWGIGLLWRSVHPDEAIREEGGKCEAECANFQTEMALNRELYEAIKALDTSGYDADAKRLVEHTLRDFRRAGVDKDAETRAKIQQLDEEITATEQEFTKNITDDVRWVEVDSVDELAGLPQDWIDAHPPGDDGKIRVSTAYPDYVPIGQYAESGELRRKLYVADRSRGDKDGGKTLRRLLELRYEKARLLGYKDFADYYIEDKMMKSGKAAQTFIDRVARLSKARAKRDYKAMLARKRKDDNKAKRVDDWEKVYYETKIKAESYDFDLQEVRQYFSYPEVKNGLLAITSEMFDVEYVPVKDPRTWHADVDVYDVMQDGAKIGRIFLDMHPREGKYSHAAQFPLTPGVNGKSLPEGALVCNFPKTLMEHDDVETMFHEFGHLMHHTFKGSRSWMMLGSVERDFVEAPSQIFEEWAWDYDVLERFAKHHTTGAVIPVELVDRMKKADEFGVGFTTQYQMYYAAMVLSFYRIPPDKLDMAVENKRLMEKYTPFEHVEGTNRHLQFGHLAGYPASYYTYMWSLVLAKDLFSPFEKHGLLDKEWTLRYRDKVLAPGGSKDAAELVKDFLGRPGSYKAFEKWLKG